MGQREDDLQRLTMQMDSVELDPDRRLREGTAGAILAEILFHADARYWQFTPAHSGAPRFVERLWQWLIRNESLTEDQQNVLLRSVPMLQFVDRDDMLSLYRAAFLGPISRWLMDREGLTFSIDPTELDQKLERASDETWFCPVTDSMNIAQFHHINGLAGKEHRPSWRTLQKFGDVTRTKAFMARCGFKRIVLLEDFVGSGVQTAKPVHFAAENFGQDTPVLFVPLIVSAFGLENLRYALSTVSGLAIQPVFVVPKHAHILEEPQTDEPAMFSALRDVVVATFDRVKEPRPPSAHSLQEPFGFNSIGALVVLYTNCPNNTVPLFWHEALRWSALFPRVSRA